MKKSVQNRQFTSNDVSCCLPVKISRVPHLRIQSCSLEINLTAVRTCLNLDSNHRHVYWCHSNWFLSPWISTFPCTCLYLEICSAACTFNQQLCVHTFHSFDILHRIVSVLLSFPRTLCLSGFLFLSCHPSCPCRISLCLSLFDRLHRLPLNLRRVCFRLKSSWRCVCSSSNLQSPRVMRWSFPVFQHSTGDVSSEARETMHGFFTWSGTGSVPFASSYRLSSRNSFRRSSTSSILEPNL